VVRIRARYDPIGINANSLAGHHEAIMVIITDQAFGFLSL
jgi:hypothetical protein